MPEALAGAYHRCRDLHRRHGRSYYLATRLLPAWKRPHVHALYGFARHADEIVDRLDGATPAERARRLRGWAQRFRTGLRGEPVDDPLLPAVLHTVGVFGLDPADFDAFLDSMAMDLTVGRYADYPALLSYMEGSAAVIGTMMLPILGPADPAAAREPARQLGLAFQLTNFLRDVGEDLARDRVYLPQDDLARFGVSDADLYAAAAGRATPEIKRLLAFEIARARRHYAAALPGIAMLPGASRACVKAAYLVYGAILDEIERLDHDVFARRAVVPAPRRAALLARGLLAR
ncbi:phytoene/squalene synthase family protein [Catellatospora sp. NPDC049609]|uniref:phytoene/squalene synthase family protein n=1 Tax=Catellatospora sp. NPDC049609 TaxID=3155505 RepID=UPI0034487D9D